MQGNNLLFYIHIKNIVQTIFIEKPNEEDKYLSNCIKCNIDLNERINKPIQYCSKCKGNLCDKCGNEHYKKNLNHKLSLRKYIRPKQFIEVSICEDCGKRVVLENKRGVMTRCSACQKEYRKKYKNEKAKAKKRKNLQKTR